jgi:pilus assembly protein TadC
LVAVVLERAPYLVRGMLRREGQARLRLRIRDFVDDLREAVAIHGSLGKALDALVATQGERTDALALVLARRARSRSAQLSADQVLDGMAADLKSPDMHEVAAQVRLALAGGMDLADALAAVTDTLSEVIAAEVNVRLQAAPNTYILPMVLFMFGPLLILMLYPVALRVVALITGGA